MSSLSRPERGCSRYSSELRRPAGTVELAERLDLRPNGVRVHLDRLERAGLVARDRARQARGRPRDAWTIAPDARPGGESPRAYADLGRWLARAMRSGLRGLRAVEATGREIGRELALRDGAAGEASARDDAGRARIPAPRYGHATTTGSRSVCATARIATPFAKTSRSSARCIAASPGASSTSSTQTPSSPSSCPATQTRPAA